VGLILLCVSLIVSATIHGDRLVGYLMGWQFMGNGVAKVRFAGVTLGPEHRPGKLAEMRQPATFTEDAPYAWIEVLDRMPPSSEVWEAEDLMVTDSAGKSYEVASPVAQYADAEEGHATLTYVGIRFASPLADPYALTIRLRLKKAALTSEVLTFHAAGEMPRPPSPR
jgi:hypothetical protein